MVGLEQELQRKDRAFQKRERVLLAQVTSLQRKVKQQAKRFHNQLTDLRHRLNNNNQVSRPDDSGLVGWLVDSCVVVGCH